MEPLIPQSIDLKAILPEIILTLGMCVAMILPVLPPFRRACRESHRPMLLTMLASLIGAAIVTLGMLAGWFGLDVVDHHVMANMLAVDRFALTFKVILYLFTIFIVVLWLSTTRDEVRPSDSPDYITLLLGGVLGMGLMASATNFLMIYLAIEAASLPSYALAGFRKSTRRASEASLKYVLFGAASSAMMLYGLSMLYGAYGAVDLPLIAARVAEQGMTVGLLLGLFGFIIGIGFKLSAVPVHFWCPDVFEGAGFEITTFLSVASKGAAIALLLRVMMSFGYFGSAEEMRGMFVGIGAFVGLIGAITATWGNLAAFFQDNVKRLLAYSSIAHAGYMIMAAGLVTAAYRHTDPQDLAYAILFYVFVYAFMNLGAFTVAAIVARNTGSESLSAFAGLGSRSPWLAVAFGVFLMSLFGMPLTGGFWGKVRLGFQMWEENMWWLVLVLVINTVFSLYFYLKPIIVMVWKPAPNRQPIRIPGAAAVVVIVSVIGVFATGLLPDPTTDWVERNSILSFQPAESRATPVVVESAMAPSAAPTVIETR